MVQSAPPLPAPPPLAAYRHAIVDLRRRARSPWFFHALGFADPGLEQEYRRQRLNRLLPMLRVGQATGVVGVVLFFVADALLWGRYGDPRLWRPMLGLVVPANLTVLALSFVPEASARGWLYRVGPAAALVNMLGLVLSIGAALRLGRPAFYEVAIGQQIYAACLLCLTFRQAWWVTTAGAALYVVMMCRSGLADDERILRSALLVQASTIGLVSAWVLERDARVGWLRARLLRGLAGHDLATGLASYRGFLGQAGRTLAQARRAGADVALILLNIDALHRFNENHGRAAGDALLVRVAGRMQGACRHARDIAGRLGAGRFGLLLFDASPAEARRVAGMLRLGVRGQATPGPGVELPATPSGEAPVATASIALVHCTGVPGLPAERFGRLLGLLETALDEARPAGPDRYVEVPEGCLDVQGGQAG